MMNLTDFINYKKKNILAAACGLLLFVLLCGCGREENLIVIGTASEQNEDETPGKASLSWEVQTELYEKQPGSLQETSENLQSRWEGQESSKIRQNVQKEQANSENRQDVQKGQENSENRQDVQKGQINSEIRQSASEKQEAVTGSETMIRIYVCGAVVNPGVVSIPEGSRVEDALLEAGGFTSEAMEHALNLADWVWDGQMLYFPAKGEDIDSLVSSGWPGYGFGGSQEEGADYKQVRGLVNINTADIAALITLPGIGEGRAQDIIDYREKNGSFASTEDIMKVSGIKTSVYEKICDKITVK